MNRLLQSTLALSFLSLFGCGRGDGDRESTASSALAINDESEAEAEVEAAKMLGPDGSRQRAVWDQEPGARKWSQRVLKRIRQRPEDFEIARDLDDFCPGYSAASRTQKDTCWLRIVSAMARYESGFKPTATYLEHTGTVSVGLLMMNPEHCPKADTEAKLKNASLNIDCALERMSLLIGRDRYLSGPTYQRGASAYWSVLRPPYTFRNLKLGKKKNIQKFTRSYLAYSTR